MRKEIVNIKVEATCLSCKKSFMNELDDEKIFCEVSGEEVKDDFDCSLWKCNYDVFNICGFDVEEKNEDEIFELVEQLKNINNDEANDFLKHFKRGAEAIIKIATTDKNQED